MSEPRTAAGKREDALLDAVYEAVDRLWRLTREGERPAMGISPGNALLALVGHVEGKFDAMAEARAAALAEVREAVRQLPGIPEAHPRAPTIRHDELYRAAVLAAIDALREKP